MPRTILGSGSQAKTPGTKALEDKLIDRYGFCLTMKALLEALGMRDRGQAKIWLDRENIQAVDVNGRDRWLATDVAQALERSKCRT